VAYCVSELFNPQLFPGTEARLSISQEEIARLSGLSRQNANKALHDLEHSGLVRMKYGVIEVLDLPGLQAFAHKS
jgi:CRP-like cAMP-binding protein